MTEMTQRQKDVQRYAARFVALLATVRTNGKGNTEGKFADQHRQDIRDEDLPVNEDPRGWSL